MERDSAYSKRDDASDRDPAMDVTGIDFHVLSLTQPGV
jgi:hypothetical protein